MDYMNYKMIQVIKKSERAEVLFASVEGLERPVVVKRLMEANPEVYRVVAGTQSLHLPEIYQIEARGDALYVVEEYVDGCMLGAYLEEEALSDEKKLELMLQLCDAVELLHRCIPPVIHRDIKPSNILITPDGVLKLIDFDAARQYKVEKNTSDTRLLGTIEYAAPEQFGYSQTDLRSDIYSVGVVFSEIKIDKKAVFAKDWKRIVDRCTNFDPENRYKNVAELKKDLLRCIRKRKSKRNYPGFVAAAMAALFLVVAGGLIINRNKEQETVSNVPTMPAGTTPVLSITNLPETTPTMTPTPNPTPNPVVKDIEAPVSVKKSKKTVGVRTESAGYLVSKMNYIESEQTDYKINDNGSVSLRFKENYSRIIFELPDVIDMNYCVNVMTRIHAPEGMAALLLYDENGNALECFDIGKTEEPVEVFFSPSCKSKVAYVGFVANAGETEEFSEVAATVFYVDFLVINPDTPKISYTMAELAEEDYYYCDYARNEDGSVTIEYKQLYGKLKLRLPKEVDMRYCVGIGLVMKSEEGEIQVNSYTSDFEYMEGFQSYKTEGVEEKLLVSYSGVAIGGVGLSLVSSEETDFFGCTSTVYAINFYMEDDYFEIASSPSATVSPGEEEIPENQKNIVGKQAEPEEYLVSDLSYVDSNNLSYQFNEDGSVSLKFTKIYDSILYELPAIIDMSCCEKITVKMDIHKGEVAVILRDESKLSVESFNPPYGIKEDEITFSWPTRFAGKAAYIGFMANDGELEDYSDFETTVYSVTFYMEE